MSMPEPYVYRAQLVRVIDGDTYDMIADLGFGLEHGHASDVPFRVRLLGVNTPELRRGSVEHRAAGRAATEYVRHWFTAAGPKEWPLMIRTSKDDSFGRWLAEVWRTGDSANLGDDLLAHGHAVTYP